MSTITAPSEKIIAPAAARPAASHTPDAALIRGIADGDRRAMQILYTRHSVRIYRFILRLTHDASLAEDLVNEVFLDVWRRAETFRGESQASTWLLGIARYKALSALRRRHDEQLDESAAATIEDPAEDPETLLHNGQRRAALERCLAELSPAHREVIDLVYYHEKSVEEVARIVGVPPSTVKTRMFYARKRIETLLASTGLGELH
jgi:RNA polymerase sigma-70 factor (ECF subfamily)